MNRLWTYDQPVVPWRGTACGVLAATNTYADHLAPVRDATHAERNAERLVTGKLHHLDSHTLQVLATVQPDEETQPGRGRGLSRCKPSSAPA
jgi:hypothetical protein